MPTRGQINRQNRLERAREKAKQAKREANSENKELVKESTKPDAVKKAESTPFNRNKTDKLRYPKRDQDLYQGQVRFKIVELSPLTGAQLANLDFVNDLLSKESLSKLDDKIVKKNEASPTEEKKRTELANKNSAKLKGRGQQSYDNPKAQKKFAGSVTLYLPQNLNIQDAVTYNSGELGAIGGGVEAGLKNGGSALNAVGAGLTQGIDSFTSLFSNAGLDRDASALALTRTAESFGPAGVAQGVKAATRVSVNPNLRTLLDRVPIRTIPFSFRLIAQDPSEAREIEKIISFFRYQLYPDEISGQIGGADVSLGYKFPDPFEISCTYKGKQVGTKFLDADLQSVAVAYNEQGAGFHADGYPTDVTMSLTFIESKALTRKLVEEGY